MLTFEMSAEQRRKGLDALAASARAFDRAKAAGHVWISDHGLLETYEMYDAWMPKAPKNPEQLRLV